ncbi:MAG: ABC transporter permease [Thermoplasmatota archaeon]
MKFREPEMITPVLMVLLVVAFIGAVAFSPPVWFYLGIVGIALLTISLFAARNLVLFKISARNIVRRKGLSAIVIGGLMVGTVIISSSLVVGDTMDEMIVGYHYDIYGEVDEVIYGTEPDGSFTYVNSTDLLLLQERLLSIDNVEAVTGEIQEKVSIIDLNSGQAEADFTLIGYDAGSKEFGSFERNGLRVPLELPDNELYIDKGSAKVLDAHKGDMVSIQTRNGPVVFRISTIIDGDARAGWGMERAVFIPLHRAQEVLGAGDSVNIVKVTNDGGVRSGERYCDQVGADIEVILSEVVFGDLELQRTKHGDVEQGKEEISEFSQMFLIFGSFSILAGIILIINIFVMLGEERKSEMGISRAVGMRRKHLREGFVYEGSIYAVISSALGAALGVGVAYLVLVFLDMIFQNGFGTTGIIDSFTFSMQSVVTAFTFGMLITILTVSLSAKRISKLNIIRAIRNIPEPRTHNKSLRVLVMGIVSTIAGVVLFITAYTSFPELGLERIQEASVHLGISIAILGSGLVLRRFIGERIAMSVATALLVVYWIVPNDMILPGLHEGDMEVFFLSGVFTVSGAVILFLYNSNDILGLITKAWSLTGRPTASLKTASSYPMKNRFRTGMTIYMFALVIFTITVMSMIVGVISHNIEQMTSEQVGNIDLIGESNPNNPIEDIYLELENNSTIGTEPFEDIYSLSLGYAEVNTTVRSSYTEGDDLFIPWFVIGVEDNFHSCGWTFTEYMEGYGSGEEVWKAVTEDSDLVVLDNSFSGVQNMGPPTPFMGSDIKVGGQIELRLADGRVVNKTVAGILDEFIMPGIFISSEFTRDELGIENATSFLFVLGDGQDADGLAKVMEKELGINMIVLKTEIEGFTRSMNQFFDLFMAFMGLGLIVGIAGLGIITLRAVHERRQEIGMMRAIGFIKRGVTSSFLTEAGFISFVGILLGTALGIGIGFTLWYDAFKPLEYDFMIPWARVGFVALVAFGATVLFTILPSLRAASVTPAEALRYE